MSSYVVEGHAGTQETQDEARSLRFGEPLVEDLRARPELSRNLDLEPIQADYPRFVRYQPPPAVPDRSTQYGSHRVPPKIAVLE
jgi:hypothetical protein